MDGRARHTAGAIVTETPTVYVDIAHDDATYISAHKLTPPTRFWAKAAASALRGLGLPLDSAVTFRRRGETIRKSSIGFLLRENSVTA